MVCVRNLSKHYGPVKILDDISFNVPQGQVVGLLGPSGCGKSTLIRCIQGLEKPDLLPISAKHSPITLSGSAVMVFQQFHLFPHMTILENITYAPMRVRKLSKDEAICLAMQLLKKVDLEDKAHAYPHILSGGQQQRIAIARALAMAPSILLLDEPTSALDAAMTQEVFAVLKALAHTGITLIIVTHETHFIQDVADRVLYMEKGKIIEDSPSSVFF